MSQIGTTVRQERERLGKTRRVLEDETGVSQRRLAEIEAGDDNMTLETARSLTASLGGRIAEAVVEFLTSDSGRYPVAVASHAA